MTVFLCAYRDYEGITDFEVCADFDTCLDWCVVYQRANMTHQILTFIETSNVPLRPGVIHFWSTVDSIFKPGFVIWEVEPRKTIEESVS